MESMAARVREHATDLVDGELYSSRRHAGPHTLAASALGGLLVPPFQFASDGPGGWWILDEPEIHFGRNVVVPDLAGWQRERMPEIPSNGMFSIVPDWICEVTSPSTGRVDRLMKMPIYRRGDVEYLWLLDPEQQMIEAYHGSGEGWSLGMYGDQPVARIEPFEAIEIDLTQIWGPLRA
jgi:Uma2 family endonuclease